MLFSYSLAVASTLALSASAATIRIDVGKSGLKFTPNTTTAAVGDILEFHYFPLNHSVVSGRFDKACAPSTSGGFFSGFVPRANNTGESPTTFSVTVNDTKPIVFYCSQNTKSHCKSGMYGVVNPSGQETLEMYGHLLGNVQSAVSPGNSPFGGELKTSETTTTSDGSGGSSTTAAPPTGTNGGSGGSGAATTTSASTSRSTGLGDSVRAPVGGFLGAVLAAALML